MKKNFKTFQLLCLAFVLFSCSASQKGISQTTQETAQPNVLFILADDLGINALNCYGNPIVESPNIDKLYSEGVHFTNGYSNDPTCAPSRASIMSGQYVSRHHVYRVADRYKSHDVTLAHMKYLPPQTFKLPGVGSGLAPEKITIAEALKAKDYATAAYGKWHLGKKVMNMTNQGFDEGFAVAKYNHFTTDPKTDVDPNEYSQDLVTRKVKDFIKRSVQSKKPFFAYVPYYLVHKPLEPKKETLAYFKKKMKGNKEVGPKEVKVLAMIKNLDEYVGELMDYLKELGIEDNTIVIFASDNGHYHTEHNIFNKPYRGVKGQTFEGGIRVPYIFKWKGHFPANTTCTEPIIHVDLYPTILGLTQTPKPANYPLDGTDISPLLFKPDGQSKRDALVWEYTNYARYNPRKHKFASEWVNVIQMDGFKLTEVVETDSYYMYNLNKDPYETTDVVNDYPNVVKKLKKRLEKWKKDTGYEPPKPNPDYKGDRP